MKVDEENDDEGYTCNNCFKELEDGEEVFAVTIAKGKIDGEAISVDENLHLVYPTTLCAECAKSGEIHITVHHKECTTFIDSREFNEICKELENDKQP